VVASGFYSGTRGTITYKGWERHGLLKDRVYRVKLDDWYERGQWTNNPIFYPVQLRPLDVVEKLAGLDKETGKRKP